jgi:glycosyltransferase involved in cell wall biosynthesis
MKRIDIVVPVFNEEACLRTFHAELSSVIDRLPYRFRVILVDDGSGDSSPTLCQELSRIDPRVEFLRLSRNFGHQAALTAGLDVADGDAVITMDSDLQHPPEAIPGFLEQWEAGAELVSGVRSEGRTGGRFKAISSRAFYRLLNAVSEVPITASAPDFRLLDARVVATVRRMRERSRFLRGMYAWIGFRQVTIEYQEASRAGGRSKYSPRMMSRLALTALLSFSRTPLRISTIVGALVATLSFAYGLYAVAQALVFRRALPGWASLAVLVSFLSGVQLLTMGIFGEYLGQVLEEARGRPLYVVSSRSRRLGPFEDARPAAGAQMEGEE